VQRFDLRLIADLMWDLFLAGYRPAAFDGASVETQTDRLGDRIDVVLTAVKA